MANEQSFLKSAVKEASVWVEDNRPLVLKMTDAGRFRHIEGVLAMALDISQANQISPLKAAQAALLHDCAKNIPPEKMKKMLIRAGADAFEKNTPALWHSVVGAWLAKNDFGIKSTDVLKAIRVHSTGCAPATALQKCLVVADRTEKGRKAAGLDGLRKLAIRDLDSAYIEVLKEKIMWLVSHGQAIHPRSIAAWNWVQKQ